MTVTPFMTLCWASLGGIVYLVVLVCQGRPKDLNPLDFGATCFSFLSFLNGVKLSGQVYYKYYNGEVTTFEMDNFFTVYGGICVVWIAIGTIKKRLTKPKTFEQG